MSRRQWLAAGAAAAGAGSLYCCARPRADGRGRDEGIVIGLVADVHYADRDPWGTRHYRDSAAKLTRFVETMKRHRVAFAVVLGDLVDKGKDLATETAYLACIEAVFRRFEGERHHVLGNHDVATFTKEQFVGAAGMPAAHYAFDAGGYHFVVLDACYRRDGEPYGAGNFEWTDTAIPLTEQRWLAADLAAATSPCVVFVHQRLDDDGNPHTVKNAPEVRRLLERSGKVVAVFNGHDHRGGYSRIGGIHYVTLRAMVEGAGPENNAYALARVAAAGIRVRGFGRQPDLDLA
jgi:alkaline phosphatase